MTLNLTFTALAEQLALELLDKQLHFALPKNANCYVPSSD